MARPIVYIDVSKVRGGRLTDLRAAMERLAAFVEKHVPMILSYAFYLDPTHSRMTVVAVHPDSASLVFHMDAGREEFRRFSDLIELEAIDVYGRVSDEARARLDQKVKMLGGSVTIHEFEAGFTRWTT